MKRLLEIFDEYLETKKIIGFKKLVINKSEDHFDYILQDCSEVDLDTEVISLLQKEFQFPANFESFGRLRKREYLLSRLMILKMMAMHFNNHSTFHPSEFYQGNLDRDLRGSISHSKNMIRVSLCLKPLLIGIDTESIKRESLDGKLWEKVSREEDQKLLINKDLDTLQYRTLLFSAKESLYKFAFPVYQKYFGFQEAYIQSIDIQKQVLTIKSEVLDSIGLIEVKVHYQFDNDLVHTLILSPY